MTRMSEIPPELLAEMTPAVRAFVESWMLQMAEMQARMQAEIDDLKAQVKKLTPKNSSVPPSTQHPHARIAEKTKPKSKKNAVVRRDTNAQLANSSPSKNVRKLFSYALLSGIDRQYAEPCCGSAGAALQRSAKSTEKRAAGLHGRNPDETSQ